MFAISDWLMLCGLQAFALRDEVTEYDADELSDNLSGVIQTDIRAEQAAFLRKPNGTAMGECYSVIKLSIALAPVKPNRSDAQRLLT